MPADHLTQPAARLTALVEAALAGQPAAPPDIHPTDLHAAVHAYRTAGRAALQQHTDRAWFHARVQPSDWASAENAFRTQIGPHLDDLTGSDAGWWFLRKHPCWRIRIHTPDHQRAAGLLDELTGSGVIAGWTPGVYEPEVAAFGGPAATDVVHDLFCRESRALLTYTRHDPPPIGRRELSLLLLRELADRACLDWFEAGDVFDRVAQMRPTPHGAEAERIDGLAQQMRLLLALPPDARGALFSPGGPCHDAAPWLHAFTHAGQQLGELAASGRLDRGIRVVLAHIVIFHWNRLGLSAITQGVLAHAATAAFIPRS